MGRNIIEKREFILTKFAMKNGVGYQINVRNKKTNNLWKWIQISEDQLIEIIEKFIKEKEREVKILKGLLGDGD